MLSPDEAGGETFVKQNSSDESSSVKSTEDGELASEAGSPSSEYSDENGIDLVVVPSPTPPNSSEEESEEGIEE